MALIHVILSGLFLTANFRSMDIGIDSSFDAISSAFSNLLRIQSFRFEDSALESTRNSFYAPVTIPPLDSKAHVSNVNNSQQSHYPFVTRIRFLPLDSSTMTAAVVRSFIALYPCQSRVRTNTSI